MQYGQTAYNDIWAKNFMKISKNDTWWIMVGWFRLRYKPHKLLTQGACAANWFVAVFSVCFSPSGVNAGPASFNGLWDFKLKKNKIP